MILLTAETPEACAVARDAAEEHGKGVWVRVARSAGDGSYGFGSGKNIEARSCGNVGSGKGHSDGTGGYGSGTESRETAGELKGRGALSSGAGAGKGDGRGSGYGRGWAGGRAVGQGSGWGQ